MDIAAALRFAAENHHAVLATRRRDGRPQLSPVAVGVDDDGHIVISTREPSMKVKNLRRDPHASLCLLNDAFFGAWAQVEGPAEIVSLPEAMDGLIAYYRSVSGEHPDWDDYRDAMQRDRRCLIRITPERAGPTVSG
ncbi:MAG TPA: PPOX class F420-dependent oxidoreductase [Acidimicrobiia bacterium]|jgi:PPOX class probable F420-dependent enzyme|nr:PPOX class F420-dependent oxidoreductase [Acidimicrobiia bacterium]